MRKNCGHQDSDSTLSLSQCRRFHSFIHSFIIYSLLEISYQSNVAQNEVLEPSAWDQFLALSITNITLFSPVKSS